MNLPKEQKVDGRYNNYNEDLNKLKNILNSFSLSLRQGVMKVLGIIKIELST